MAADAAAKTCPQCGRATSAAARWCIGCRYSFEAPEAQAQAPRTEVGCPSCGGPRGWGQQIIRAVGETKTHGIPLIASVSVTAYHQGLLTGLCSACDWALFRKRWLAWTLGWVPVMALFGAASAFESALLAALGGIALILLLRGIFYNWLDDLVWGQALVHRLGMPEGRYHIPASIGHVLGRGLLGPWLVTILLVMTMVVLERLRQH